MASTIITKYSGTASAVPVSGDLTQGELAVNVTDKRLFTKNSGGTVVELGTNPASLALPNGTANGVLYLNGSKVATSGSALTFDGTYLNLNFVGQKLSDGYGLFWGSGTSTYVAGSGASNYINFIANSAEQMRLTSTGLGIGTSSPTQKLDVAGQVTISSGNGYLWGNGAVQIYSNLSYLRFRTASTDRLEIDSSGNLGLGVTPSAWYTGGKALQIFNGSGGSLNAYAGEFFINQNAYLNSDASNWIRNDAGYASQYHQVNGKHIWKNAASSTAGSAITFTQAMTLDASGNLGIGATSSSGRVQINGANTTYDTNCIGQVLVRSTTAYNATPRAGIAFSVLYNSAGDYTAGGCSIQCYKENSTNGDFATGLLFTTQAYGGAPAERARIDSSGNLLVGTTNTSPSSGAGLKVYPAGKVYAVNADSTNSTECYGMYSTGAAAYRFYVGWGGTIYATSTTITSLSDQRLKENICDLDDGLEKVMALKPRKFDWKEGKGGDIKNARGFIAQEFETVFPDMIEEWKDPAPEGEEPYKAVNANLIPTLVKAIQEQQAIIQQLQADVAALKGN